MTARRAIRISTILLAGVFFMVAARKTDSQSCCQGYPTTETSEAVGPFAFTKTIFKQTISDGAGTIFDSRTVTEQASTTPNVDNCHWAGSSVQPAALSGGTWVVNSGQVRETNKWGWDHVGFGDVAVDTIRREGPAHGVTLPCTATVYQNMNIECDASLFIQYLTDNVLQTTVAATTVQNCRRGTCHTIQYTTPPQP